MRIRINKNKVIVKDGDLDFSLRQDTNGDKIIAVFELAGEGTIGILSCPASAKNDVISKVQEMADFRLGRLVDAALKDQPYDLYDALKVDQNIIDNFVGMEE